MAKRRIIPLFIPHLGCPNGCVFCDQKKITGVDTPVTGAQVRMAIEQGLGCSGPAPELAFYGGSFTAIPVEKQESLLGAAQPFLQDGHLGSIRLSTRPDCVDRETAERLCRFGVTTVELGCQSMDETVLGLVRRGHSPADTWQAVKCLKEAGLQVILQMMTGLPGDRGPQSLTTAREIIAMKPDGVRIYPTVVLRGTELEGMMHRGEYVPQSVEEAVELCSQLYEAFLAAEIPVIRVGLNPTEDLSGGEAVAGAYHPALGERVLSRMYLRRAEGLLRQNPPGENLKISVHPSRVSVMVGQKRENILALCREFGIKRIKVLPEAGELWEISLKNG